jgi:hypothetical protein
LQPQLQCFSAGRDWQKKNNNTTTITKSLVILSQEVNHTSTFKVIKATKNINFLVTMNDLVFKTAEADNAKKLYSCFQTEATRKRLRLFHKNLIILDHVARLVVRNLFQHPILGLNKGCSTHIHPRNGCQLV